VEPREIRSPTALINTARQINMRDLRMQRTMQTKPKMMDRSQKKGRREIKTKATWNPIYDSKSIVSIIKATIIKP
jgi:hypothetical protein